MRKKNVFFGNGGVAWDMELNKIKVNLFIN